MGRLGYGQGPPLLDRRTPEASRPLPWRGALLANGGGAVMHAGRAAVNHSQHAPRQPGQPPIADSRVVLGVQDRGVHVRLVVRGHRGRRLEVLLLDRARHGVLVAQDQVDLSCVRGRAGSACRRGRMSARVCVCTGTWVCPIGQLARRPGRQCWLAASPHRAALHRHPSDRGLLGVGGLSPNARPRTLLVDPHLSGPNITV